MNNFTRSSGNAYWHAITNLTCCSVDLKKMQLFKTFLVLMLFAFSSTSMFAQNRTTFYEVCVEDRPEGLTEEQALALFPNVDCEGTLSVEKIEDLQGGDCGWVSIYEYILYCDEEQLAIEKLIYEGGDIEAPKLEVPADVTVECDAIPNPGTPTATDNCDDDVEITYDGEIRVGEDDCNYVLQRTWTATDECGLTHTVTQTITVVDTTAPKLNKGAEIPTGETGLNLCYDDRPDGPTADEIKALFSDNCGEVLVEKNPVFKGTDCNWKGYINYFITDDCGNEADTITLYYNGGDKEAPVFVDPPADIEVTCIDLIPQNYTLQWTDNCAVSDPKAKGLGVDDTSGLGEACEGGVMTRTWTAVDNCNNSVTHTQTITVLPAPPVSFDELEDLEIKCEELAAFEPGQLYYSNGGSGACDINGYVQGVAEDFSENCGSFTVTYTYEDTCNSITHVQTITVIDDVDPTLEIPADETVECDSVPGVGEASATDNCDEDVDVKYDGEVRTDGECQDSYTLTRTWTATDNCGNSTTLSQTITVVDTTAPVLTIPADETVECDSVPGVGEASATDNCDADVTVTFVDEKREDGNCADSYILFRVWSATDNCGNTTLKTQQITVVDTTAPVIDGVNDDYTAECPEELAWSNPTATDNCDAEVTLGYSDEVNLDECGLGSITRTWTATDNCENSSQASQTITIVDTTAPVISEVGDDMTIDCPAQPEFSEPKVEDACDDDVRFEYSDDDKRDDCGLGEVTRTWTATDCAGNVSTAQQTITVQDVTAPEIVGVGDDMTIDCPAQPEFSQPQAIDACDQQASLDYVDDDKRDDCGLGEITRTWTATDCAGNSSQASQTITIQDITDPEITVPGDVTVECDAIPALGEASATDTCDNDVHVKFVEERREDGACEDSYTLFRIWLATDCAGNSTLGTQKITVVDTTAPVFAGVGEDDKIECPEGIVFSEPTASDNCDADVTITFEDKDDRDECGLGSVTRTWTATDNCGNSSEASQTITVEDNIAPVIDGVEDDYTVECPEELKWSEPTVSDTCDEDPDLRYEDSSDLDECGLGTVTRTWYATDCAGNESSDSQTITIDDTVAPVISGVEADYTVECPEELVWSNPSASDACDAEPKLDYEDDYNLDNCGLGTVTRTWTATDCAGNESTDSQTITIADTTAPVISGVGADETIECPKLPEFSQPTVSDTCDSAPSLTYEDKDDRDDCGLGSITRTWTATDCAGNTSSASQTITVEDNVAPVIDGVGEDFTVECPEGFEFSEPTASDECSDTGFNAEDWTINEGYDGTITLTSNKLTIVGGNDGSGFYDDSNALTTCPINGTYSFDWSYSTEDDPFYDFAYYVNGTGYLLSDVFGSDVQSGTLTLNCQAGDVIGFGVFSDDSLFGAATLEVTNYNAPGEGVDLTFEDVEDLDECGLGTITRTWTATDCAGNSSQESQVVTIEDNIAPEITEVGDDMTIDCPAQPEFSEPKVSDACDDDPSLTFEDDDKRDECGLGEVTRTWTATDCAGNTSTASQTITVQDITDPYFNEELPQDVTEECDAVTPAVTLTASDTCDTDVKVEFSEEKIDGDCAGRYTLIRTWTAEDCAGNDIEHVQTVTVVDTTAPVQIADIPESINEINACASEAPTPLTEEEFALLFEDNCSGVVVSLFSSAVGNDCGWSVIHIYTVSDGCGNLLGDFKVYYSGEDLDAPVLNDVPGDIEIACTDEIPAPANVTATDDCDPNVEVQYGEQIVEGNCAGNYDIIRTWSAEDACGNYVSASQTIEVRDYEAPVLIKELPEGDNQINACAPDTDEELAELGVLTADEFELLYEDNCSGVNVNRVINLDGDDCKWIMWVRYDITDDCGNEAQSVKLWYHGADETAPVPTGLCENEVMELPSSQTGVCPADAVITHDDEITSEEGVFTVAGVEFNYSNLKPCFVDNCATQDELTFVVTGTDEGSKDDTCSRTMTITFDVYDNCENAYEGFVCTFIILDDEAPVITKADDVVAECDGTNDAFDAWLANNGGHTATDCNEVTWTNDYNDCGQEFTDRMLTSEADFSGTETFVNFDDIDVTGTYINPNGTEWNAQGVTFSSPSDMFLPDMPFFYAGFPNLWNSSPNALTNSSNGSSPITMDFASVVNRAGFYIGTNDDDDVQLYATCYHNGVEVGQATLVTDLQSKFFGFESENGFDRIVLEPITTVNGFIVIDDLRFEGCDSGAQYGQINECSKSTTVTFTATDACGHSSSTTSTFTVEDTTAPTVTCPADMDFKLGEQPVFAGKANYSDECSGDGETEEYSDAYGDDVYGETVTGNDRILGFTAYGGIFVNFGDAPAGTDGNGNPYWDGNIIDLNGNIIYPDYTYKMSFSTFWGDWEVWEYYQGSFDFYLVAFGGGYSNTDPSCDENDWIGAFYANCEQTKQIVTKSMTRTFYAYDDCGNEGTCDVNYTWEECYDPQITGPNFGEGEGFNGLPVVERPTQAQANDETGEDSMLELDFTAYPVPFDREVSVKFNFEFDTDVTIEVHDTKGLLIMSETLKGVRKDSDTTRKLDLSKGADQLFYITVTTNQGSVTKKVVSSNIKRR